MHTYMQNTWNTTIFRSIYKKLMYTKIYIIANQLVLTLIANVHIPVKQNFTCNSLWVSEETERVNHNSNETIKTAVGLLSK